MTLVKQELVFQERLEAETQKLQRLVQTQQREMETLIKAEQKLLGERAELKAQLDNTKRYIGSIVSTVEPKERESKALKMVKELTATIIEKEVEVSKLRDDLRSAQSEETSIYRQYLSTAAELKKAQEGRHSAVALLQHLAQKSGFKQLADLVQEFVNRLEVATDSHVWFEKVVNSLSSLQVGTSYADRESPTAACLPIGRLQSHG